MAGLTAPFLANDQGDVSIYESLEDMAAQFEPIDALDGAHEFFDARGTVLDPVPTDERWRPVASIGEPQPERLARILRSYFDRLPQELGDFSNSARRAKSLEELVALRQQLGRQPTRSLGSRLLRRRRHR